MGFRFHDFLRSSYCRDSFRLRGIAEGTDSASGGSAGCDAAAEILDSLINQVKLLPVEEVMAQESLKIQAMTALFKQLQARLPSRGDSFLFVRSSTYESTVRPKALEVMKAVLAKMREAAPPAEVEMQRQPSDIV